MRVALLALIGVVLGPAVRHVTVRYGARPPLWSVVAASAGTLALCGALGGRTGTGVAAYAWVGAFGACLAFIDAAVRRLPDPLTLPAFAGALVLQGLGGRLLPALLGAVALSGAYLLLALLRPDGMGLGDVKLALCLGALLGPLGPGAVALGGAAGLALGGLYAVALVLLRRADRTTHLPHGPFMLLGTLATLLLTG